MQEFVEIVMKCWWLFGSIDVRMKLLGVCLDQRGFLELGVFVEVTETDPIVESDGKSKKEQSKGPEVELRK